MHIEAIEIRHVAMPLLSPWKTASHEATAIHAVFVRIESNGVSAWGEAAPLSDPTYSPEWAGAAFETLKYWLAPALLGEDVVSGKDLQDRLGIFKGNYFAKGALDCAWWALDACLAGVPLHIRVGGVSDRVEIGADFGVTDSYDTLVSQIGEALDQGFRRVKLKFRPGWEAEMVDAVRSTFPNLLLHIDCNSGYTLDDIELFKHLDQYDLAMIEQPLAFDDLVDHAKLARQIETPICLDETIVSTDRVRHAIDLGACSWINIKHGRVGGITNAIEINKLCEGAGIQCWVGSMLESAVGSALSIAVASRAHIHYPADVFPTDRHYAEDIAYPEIEFEKGCSGGVFALASEAPGIAPKPHPERLQAATVAQALLEAV